MTDKTHLITDINSKAAKQIVAIIDFDPNDGFKSRFVIDSKINIGYLNQQIQIAVAIAATHELCDLVKDIQILELLESSNTTFKARDLHSRYSHIYLRKEIERRGETFLSLPSEVIANEIKLIEHDLLIIKSFTPDVTDVMRMTFSSLLTNNLNFLVRTVQNKISETLKSILGKI